MGDQIEREGMVYHSSERGVCDLPISLRGWMRVVVGGVYLEVVEHGVGSVGHVEPEERVAVGVELAQTLHGDMVV